MAAARRRAGASAVTSVLAAIAVVILASGCSGWPLTPAVTPEPTVLAMDATGLGPCTQPWWTSCNYGIRVEGPGGYDHRGNFAWDEGRTGIDHGPNGDVASTGVYGDVPATLGPGIWTISFRLWYGSDEIEFGSPVPGGTPRYRQEDPFTAACSTVVDTSVVASATLRVAFDGGGCTITPHLVGR